MKIYVYLDESGSIHKNSSTKYFAIGGYIVYGDKYVSSKVINRYKKINKKHKKIREVDLTSELKARDMSVDEKIEILTKIQTFDNFYGCAIIFDKTRMFKKISNANLFFNYGVKVLFQDSILPILPENETYEFILSVDTRNVSVGEKDDLEKFLNTTYCYNEYSFKVTYYDSATHYGIQLADLIVNTMYMRSKNRSLIDSVLKVLDVEKFRLSIFPGYHIYGKQNKIVSKSKELTTIQ